MTSKIILKSFIFLILGLTYGFVISSCGRGYLISRDLNTIEKGKSIQESEEIIGRDPKEVFSFVYNEKNIDVGIYPMLYNQYSYTTHTYDIKGGSQTQTVTVVETQDFGIMYVDGKLYNTFWIADVNKQEDDLTQRVAPIIAEKYLEKYINE
jgi:hypothetical protein